MLQNAYFLAKSGADTAEIELHFAEMLPIGRRPSGCRLGRRALRVHLARRGLRVAKEVKIAVSLLLLLSTFDT